MAFASDPRFLVLHGLRLKGFCDVESLRAATGVDRPDAEKHLDALRNEQLVLHREGRLSGWALTPAGRAEHARLIAEETENAALRDPVQSAYERFLAINTHLLAVCTDWQMRSDLGPQAINDHSDAAYDQRVIARLADIDDGVQPVCGELAAVAARFASYGSRLASARALVEAGDIDWFTKPLIDSYHTVWFELHEDLLVTLAIERSKEGQP